MANMKLVEKWLEKADEDFGYASQSLDDELEFYAQICFHFHQAAEKYLKAYIVKHELEFKKIHDLLELLDVCTKHEPKLKRLKSSCVMLNRFYIGTRYPVHWEASFLRKDATSSMKAAKKIATAVKRCVFKKTSSPHTTP